MPPDCSSVGEDANTENDDDTGRQLASDSQLVTEENDEGSNQHVRDERYDKHLVVEDAVQDRADAAEYGIKCGHDRDGQIGLQPDGHGRVKDHAEHNADGESESGNHGDSNGWA